VPEALPPPPVVVVEPPAPRPPVVEPPPPPAASESKVRHAKQKAKLKQAKAGSRESAPERWDPDAPLPP
jgi:hypothetical protein